MIDFLYGAVAGIIFSILITVMLLKQIRNAKKLIVDNRTYLFPCSVTPVTFFSVLLLTLRLKKYDTYLIYLVVGMVLCIILTIVFYVLLYCFDKFYLRYKYQDIASYVSTPWYFTLITAIASSTAFTTLLGWLSLIFLSF